MTTAIHETALIAPGVHLGIGVVVMEGVHLEADVTVGHHTVIYPGTSIAAGTVVGDHCVLGRQVLTSPISARKVGILPPLQIGRGCVIGASCVLVAGSRLGDFVLVGDLASIRELCDIRDHVIVGRGVMVEYETVIGEATKIQTGCHITGNAVIEDHVFFGPEVTTANDNRMGRAGIDFTGPHVKSRARVGANATLLAGTTVGREAVVGAGAVVVHDVPDGMVAVGVPARVIKRVDPHELPLEATIAAGPR